MDFEVRYTEKQQAFRAEVAHWLQQTVPEILRGREEHEHEPYEVYQQRRELGRRMGAKGWLYPSGPAEYGGGGMDQEEALVIMEELNKLGLSLPPYYDSGGVLGSMAILVWGTEEQKQRFLPPIYKGEKRTWQLLTEPDAGSDLANIKTTAVRDGDDWLISGQKIYIGSEHGADAYWTLARTDASAPRHQNLGWFMIDSNTEGIVCQPMRLIGGMEKQTIFLDNVRVPDLALVGGANNGWKVATTHLELEHGFRSDTVLGYHANRKWDGLLRICLETGLGGDRIVDDPVRREMLAQAYVRREIQRLWGLRNFWLASAKRKRSYEGSQAYYYGKVTGMWMNRLVTELAGPGALLWGSDLQGGDGLLGNMQANHIGGSHGGGTIDIQRVVMSRRLGIGRTDSEQGAKLG